MPIFRVGDAPSNCFTQYIEVSDSESCSTHHTSVSTFCLTYGVSGTQPPDCVDTPSPEPSLVALRFCLSRLGSTSVSVMSDSVSSATIIS